MIGAALNCMARRPTAAPALGRRAAQRGVSLIEVIASLGLLALMLAMLPAMLDQARKALSAKPRAEANEMIALANANLARWLSSARPLERRLPDGNRIISFEGQVDRISFVAVPPESLSSTGLATFTFALAPGRSGTGNLAISIDEVQTGDGPATIVAEKLGSTSILVEEVDSLSFRYFGAPTREDGSQELGKRWQNTWLERQNLPELIEITYDPTGGSRQTVVAATRLGRRQ